MLHHQPRANQVDAQDAGEVFNCVIEDAFHAARNAGVGKCDVEMAVLRDCCCNQRRHIGFIACVHLHGSRGITYHRRGVMHRCRHVAQNDFSALGRKADGGRAANA